MNYIGPVIALAAALHLMALPLPARVAGLLRKLALLLTIFAPPAMLAFYYIFFAGEADFPLFYDLETNFRAALELYQGSGDVFSVPGAVSFPVPTFWFYWLASAFGRFEAAGLFIGFTLLAALCWVAALFLLRGDIRARLASLETSARKEQFFFIILAVPAAQSVGQGQTATMVLLAVVIAWLAMRSPFHFLAGLALGLAVTIKPQVGLVALGLLTVAAIDAAERARVTRMLGGMVVGALGVILVALILPGGAKAGHIEEFFADVLPTLAPPTEEFKVHGSLAFLTSVLMTRAGIAEGPTNAVSNAVTLAIVLAFVWKTVQWRRDGMSVPAIFAMWLAVTVFAPKLTWNFYAAWTLPTFLLLASGPLSRGRLALIFITLMLLNVQVADTPIAVIPMTLLMALVWGYEKSSPPADPIPGLQRDNLRESEFPLLLGEG
jgi:hypothetical protein